MVEEGVIVAVERDGETEGVVGGGEGYLSLVLACATFLVLGVASAAFAVVLPEVRDDYGVSNTAVGLFFLGSTAGYLISALASGTLVMRLGQRALLLLGVALFGAGYALFGFEPIFAGAVVGRFVASLGVGGLEAGINIGLAARPKSGPVMNTAHAFWGVGALLGPVVAATLIAAGWDWSRLFLLFAAMSLPLLVAFGRPRWRASAGQVAVASLPLLERMPPAAETRAVVRLAGAFLVIYVAVEASLGNWGYSLLTDEYGLSGRFAGWAISSYWLGLTAARLTLSRMAAARGVSDRVLLRACIAGVAVGLVLIGAGAHVAVAAVGFVVAGFALGPVYSTGLAALGERVPRSRLPSAIGMVTSLSILGAAVGPWFAGILADYLTLWSLVPYNLLLTGVLWVLWQALGVRR
jgi:fucose permease